MKKIKVRFNLGRGKNYMKWKVESPTGTNYYNPTEFQLILNGCQLKNSRKTAERILNGEHKTVCAWVLCDSITIKDNSFESDRGRIKLNYNPRKLPYWNIDGEDLDNRRYERIISVDYGLYI